MKLLLDYDGPGSVDVDRFKTIVHGVGLKVNGIKAFNTARGVHLYLDVEFKSKGVHAFGDMDVLMLQALLGSDYRREMFNYTRIRSGVPHWNVLFEEKWGFDEQWNKELLSKETPYLELEMKLWQALEEIKQR